MTVEDVRIGEEIGSLRICSVCCERAEVEDMRIGEKIGSLRNCSAVSELRCGEAKNNIYRLDLALIIAKGLGTYLQFI